jgi:hypothetical protein
MGGSQPRNQTTTTVTQYPAWLEGPMRDNIGRANDLANQRDQAGYQGYNPADRIANFNQYQLNALENARNSVGNWTPLAQRAADGNASAASLATQAASRPMGNYAAQAAYAGPSAMVQAGSMQGANYGAYMNPYTDLVTKNALSNLEDSRQMQNVSNADAATRAKAFGGSRHGVVESMTNSAFAKQAGDLSLNAANQNFLNAQGLIQSDLNRNLQAQGMNQGAFNQMNQFNAGLAQQANMQNSSQGLQADLAMRGIGLDAAGALQRGSGLDSELASRYQSMNANDINNLMNVGNLFQDQDQAYRDFAYQEFLNRQNFPIDNLNLRFSAINNTPYQPGSSTTTPMYRNRAGGFLGGAASGASAGAGFGPWGMAIGALAGGLLGGR